MVPTLFIGIAGVVSLVNGFKLSGSAILGSSLLSLLSQVAMLFISRIGLSSLPGGVSGFTVISGLVSFLSALLLASGVIGIVVSIKPQRN